MEVLVKPTHFWIAKSHFVANFWEGFGIGK